jgi:hypothetical protein
MTQESDILYQNGSFWVCKAKKGYEVYEDGVTHASRRAIIGSDGPQWFERAKIVTDRRAEEARNNQPNRKDSP